MAAKDLPIYIVMHEVGKQAAAMTICCSIGNYSKTHGLERKTTVTLLTDTYFGQELAGMGLTCSVLCQLWEARLSLTHLLVGAVLGEMLARLVNQDAICGILWHSKYLLGFLTIWPLGFRNDCLKRQRCLSSCSLAGHPASFLPCSMRITPVTEAQPASK